MPNRVKNWERFQHFKDRRPPWIKMYRELLDDPDWHALDGDSAKVLVMLWLVASEDESKQGKLPELRKLAFRLRMEEKQVEQALKSLGHWIESDTISGGYQADITLISPRYQLDAPETETETETDICAAGAARTRFVKPTVEDVRDYCREKGYQVDPETFVNFYEAKGWMIGKNKMKSWKASVATWQKNQAPAKSQYRGHEV